MSAQKPVSPAVEAEVILQALRSAVAKALDRKRRLGQYAVVWSGNAPIAIGDDAPAELQRVKTTQK